MNSKASSKLFNHRLPADFRPVSKQWLGKRYTSCYFKMYNYNVLVLMWKYGQGNTFLDLDVWYRILPTFVGVMKMPSIFLLGPSESNWLTLMDDTFMYTSTYITFDTGIGRGHPQRWGFSVGQLQLKKKTHDFVLNYNILPIEFDILTFLLNLYFNTVLSD